MILLHGTTRLRAELIVRFGPDPHYAESLGQASDDGFATYVEGGRYMFHPSEECARRKSALFPSEGGPAILRVDVPDDIIQKTDLQFFPLVHGVVQFNEKFGFEELRKAWPNLPREVRFISP